MENWLEKAHKKYLGYDPNVWVGEFFDDKTGGYVVVNRNRWVKAIKYKNEGRKYESEFAFVKVFAQNGYAIEMLNEISGISSPDVTINGVPAEIKCAGSAANIERYARKATRRQGARMVLFRFEKMTPYILKELKNLSEKGIQVMYIIKGETGVQEVPCGVKRTK